MKEEESTTNFEKFSQLHYQGNPFILPNAWNSKSAQLLERAGFKAIGTSSGAIAESFGYPDGEKISFDELLYVIERIKAVTTIPLSVDMERGYSDNMNILSDNIQKLIDSGVSGINIEDAQGEDVYLRKLEGVKDYLAKTNQHLFINARTEAFLQKLSSPLEITIKRAKLYEAAGANGLFVTAVPDAATIREITASTSLPVNVVSTPAISSVKEFADCGVKRISMAFFLYRTTYNHLEKIAAEIYNSNSLAALF